MVTILCTVLRFTFRCDGMIEFHFYLFNSYASHCMTFSPQNKQLLLRVVHFDSLQNWGMQLLQQVDHIDT